MQNTSQKKPKIVRNIHDWKSLRSSPEFKDKTIGFVPTMGALHAGHVSLLEKSRSENDVSVLSIFVNPTQFDDPNDQSIYPKTLDSDLILAEKSSVDYVFYPTYDEIYPDQYNYKVTESELSQKFCGAYRPGHFDGVLTVVLKLLNLVRPDRSYFGEKDFQQYLLIKKMKDAFFIPSEIISCPTVRDVDGLALSSRNVNLTEEQRKLAAEFPKILCLGDTPAEVSHELQNAGFDVDYVEEFEGRRLAAVRVGQVRLIDNIEQ